MKKSILPILAVVVLLITVGCSPAGQQATATAEPPTGGGGMTTPEPAETETGSSTGDTLANTQWTLVSFGPEGQEAAVVQASTITLEFDGEGQAGGSAGCNSYGGAYSVEGDTLSFEEIVSTLMACDNEAVMEQEGQYLGALRAAGRFEQTADSLTIWYNNEAGRLNYVPLTPSADESMPPSESNNLTNTEWVLESFGSPGAETPVVEGSIVTLQFEETGEVGGSGGCNSFGGQYTVEGNTLTIGELASTLRACADDNLNQQEQQYLQALQAADSFELVDGRLSIFYGGGEGALNFGISTGP